MHSATGFALCAGILFLSVLTTAQPVNQTKAVETSTTVMETSEPLEALSTTTGATFETEAITDSSASSDIVTSHEEVTEESSTVTVNLQDFEDVLKKVNRSILERLGEPYPPQEYNYDFLREI